MVSTENESEMKRSGRGRSKKARLYASAKALVKWKGLHYPQVRSPESMADSTNVQIAPDRESRRPRWAARRHGSVFVAYIIR